MAKHAGGRLGATTNDLLDGGAGADQLAGGSGDDTYVVDSVGDVVAESVAAGVDLVQASISYALGSNVENLSLTGAAAINGTGNSLDNLIFGNQADNVIDGGLGQDKMLGGAGTMVGGAGSDTYVVDNAADVVTEITDEGFDEIVSSVSFTLGANVEGLTLSGSAAINGTGNALNNVLVGNGASNVLNGGAGGDSLDGGAGSDSLVGGLGDDIYVVDNAGDVVTEALGQGMDEVVASIAYSLGANLENLTLTGTGAINGAGNALDNLLTGNVGSNVLDGADGNDTLDGGAGADTLRGGLGDDVYLIDNAADTVVENANAGTDVVQSSLGYVLGANLENLTLTGGGAINATGNALDNVLVGNSADNIIDGKAGNDRLAGGGGNDTFLFGRALP